MSTLKILPELTKSYILERVSQEEIMEFYNGVPVNNYTLTANSFCSTMRDDDNPTCNYFYKQDRLGNIRLKLTDWRGDFSGDIFDVASFFTQISAKTSQGFKLLLHKVALDFKIHIYADEDERIKLNRVITDYVKVVSTKVFNVIPRKWNNFDKKYWYDDLSVTPELLRIGVVIPVGELEIEGKDGYLHKNYKYSAKDPAYAYYGGRIGTIIQWKIYFPYRGKGGRRFMTNSAFLQGLNIVSPARIGIITKSYKDVLVYKMFGLEAIAVPSETYLMSKDEYFNFKSKFDIVITNFDYDAAGIMLTRKYRKVYKTEPMMFTRGRFNQPDYGVKDMSEFRQTYGEEKTKNLINSLLDKYEEELNTIDRYNYTSLSWIV